MPHCLVKGLKYFTSCTFRCKSIFISLIESYIHLFLHHLFSWPVFKSQKDTLNNGQWLILESVPSYVPKYYIAYRNKDKCILVPFLPHLFPTFRNTCSWIPNKHSKQACCCIWGLLGKSKASIVLLFSHSSVNVGSGSVEFQLPDSQHLCKSMKSIFNRWDS